MNNEKQIKRLYRSKKERLIAGVCGGIAVYFGIDPTWVRLIFIVLLLGFGAIILVYILLWIIVPEEPDASDITLEQKSPPDTQ